MKIKTKFSIIIGRMFQRKLFLKFDNLETFKMSIPLCIEMQQMAPIHWLELSQV